MLRLRGPTVRLLSNWFRVEELQREPRPPDPQGGPAPPRAHTDPADTEGFRTIQVGYIYSFFLLK